MKYRKRNRGWFRRGHDPRRHRLTEDECRKGYQAAVAALKERGTESLWLLWRVKARGHLCRENEQNLE